MNFEAVKSKIRVNFDHPELLPAKEDVFKALELCPLRKTKVVILGQDPYPFKQNAMGLAFSVPAGVPIPASLRTIFKELSNNLDIPTPTTGDLTPWAKQGVLLLNTVLTTLEGQPLAHKNRGWETFTTNILKKLIARGRPLVIIAWGQKACDKVRELDTHEKILIIEGGHPSPLNTKNNFLGGEYFTKTNDWLAEQGCSKLIDWRLK